MNGRGEIRYTPTPKQIYDRYTSSGDYKRDDYVLLVNEGGTVYHDQNLWKSTTTGEWICRMLGYEGPLIVKKIEGNTNSWRQHFPVKYRYLGIYLRFCCGYRKRDFEFFARLYKLTDEIIYAITTTIIIM